MGAGCCKADRRVPSPLPALTLGRWEPLNSSTCSISSACAHARGLGAAKQLGVVHQLYQTSRSGVPSAVPNLKADQCAPLALPALTFRCWAQLDMRHQPCQPSRSRAGRRKSRSVCAVSSASSHAWGLGAAKQLGMLLQLCHPSPSVARRCKAGRRAPSSLPAPTFRGWTPQKRSVCSQ